MNLCHHGACIPVWEDDKQICSVSHADNSFGEKIEQGKRVGGYRVGYGCAIFMWNS